MNRKAIQASHAVIANLLGPGRGFGTIREIEYAAANNTMVVVVGDFPHSLMTWDLTLADSLEGALDAVLQRVAEVREDMQRGPMGIILGQIRPPETEE